MFELRHRWVKFPVTMISTVLLTCLVALAAITVKTTAQISLGKNGQENDAATIGSNGSPAICSNGGFMAFRSNAANIDRAHDSNAFNDVFLRDPKTAIITKQSLATDGKAGDAASTNPALSPITPDGFYALAFESNSSNLGTATLSQSDSNIFVRFPTLGITDVVSPGTTGSALTLPNGSSNAPSITVLSSPNRALVAFQSDATNLVTGDPSGTGITDIFLATFVPPSSSAVSYNLSSSSVLSIKRITHAFGQTQEPDASSTEPGISVDGQFIAFSSHATNLLSTTQVGNFNQIYLYNIKTDTTELISKNALGASSNGTNSKASVSYGGRYIAFISSAHDLPGINNTNDASFVVRYDRLLNKFQEADVAADGVTAGNGFASSVSISPNGRFVIFSTDANNLVPNDTNGSEDVFLKDLSNGDISRLSTGPAGVELNNNSGNAVAALPSFNSSTAFAVFRSDANNIVSDPKFLSGQGDIFINSATLAARSLSPDTQPEVPPDVSAGRKKLTVTGEKFQNATSSAHSSAGSLLGHDVEAATVLGVNYEFHVDGTGSNRLRAKLISKRNKVTVRGLKPGTYSTSYRVLSIKKKTGKVVRKTKMSPKIKVKVK